MFVTKGQGHHPYPTLLMETHDKRSEMGSVNENMCRALLIVGQKIGQSLYITPQKSTLHPISL